MVGEHIRALKGGRWIHAIDCGDETVLHLAEDQSPRRVRRAYRPDFVSGADTVELVKHRERTFSPKEVVRRAYSRAADSTLAAMFRDSEAFAEWCTIGRLQGPRNVAMIGLPAAEPEPRASRPSPRATPRREKRSAARRKVRRPAKAAKRTPAASKAKGKAEGGARAARRTAPRAKTARRAAKPVKRKGGRR